jgi:hypothetical protein
MSEHMYELGSMVLVPYKVVEFDKGDSYPYKLEPIVSVTDSGNCWTLDEDWHSEEDLQEIFQYTDPKLRREKIIEQMVALQEELDSINF